MHYLVYITELIQYSPVTLGHYLTKVGKNGIILKSAGESINQPKQHTKSLHVSP